MSEPLPTTKPAAKINADWNDEELASATVAYLAMLRKELAGVSFNKALVNRQLRTGALAARSGGSIEFRMRNISATLYDMRIPHMVGYVPATQVGSRVKERIKIALETLGIDDLRNFVPTADPVELDAKVSALLQQPQISVPKGEVRPAATATQSLRYLRDPAVKAWILSHASGICEGCAAPAPFLGNNGQPYLEVHHIVQLASLGSDRVSNAAALCPNCHRRCHSSGDRDEFKLSLYERIERLQIEVPEASSSGLIEIIEIE